MVYWRHTFERGYAMRIVFMMSLLLVAAYWDRREHRIPNVLIVAGWLSALLLRCYSEGWQGIQDSIIAIVITIACGFPLFLIHGIGAGDIKLFSVIAAMHGLYLLAGVVIVSFLMAGVASLFLLFRKRAFGKQISCFFRCAVQGKINSYCVKQREKMEFVIALAPWIAAGYGIVILGYLGGRI